MDENQMPPEAGDSLAAPAAGGAQPVTVPSDLLPEAKPGDTYKVQSVDGGNVTLEHQPGESGDDGWGEGLTKAAPRTEEM